MTDHFPNPSTGEGLPVVPSGASPAGNLTAEQAREAIRMFENSPDWHRVRWDENAPGRLALMDWGSALYDAG